MKYVKYAIIALAPVILIVGLLLTLGGGDKLPDSLKLVNVVTGEITSVNRNTMKGSMPYRDDNGDRVLFPVSEDNGVLTIKPRYQDLIVLRFADQDIVVDKETFVVQTNQ